MASSRSLRSWTVLCLLVLAIALPAAPVQATRKHVPKPRYPHPPPPKSPPPPPQCPKHGELMCDGACTNSTTDELNCGSCGHDCTALVNPYGACCGGKCVDFGYDTHHCGGCNSVCPHGTACCSQSCASLLTDILNCGACENICDTSYCCNGKCTQYKSDNEQCGCEPFCP